MVEIPILYFVIICLVFVILGSVITFSTLSKAFKIIYKLFEEDQQNDQK